LADSTKLLLLLITTRSGKEWQTQVFLSVVDSVVGEMKRRFLDHEIMKVAEAAYVVAFILPYGSNNKILLGLTSINDK